MKVAEEKILNLIVWIILIIAIVGLLFNLGGIYLWIEAIIIVLAIIYIIYYFFKHKK